MKLKKFAYYKLETWAKNYYAAIVDKPYSNGIVRYVENTGVSYALYQKGARITPNISNFTKILKKTS